MSSIDPKITADAAKYKLDVEQVLEIGRQAVKAKENAYCM